MRDENSSVCVRCERSGTECIFVPRANASSSLVLSAGAVAAAHSESKDILRRLQRIEDHLGLKDGGAAEMNMAASDRAAGVDGGQDRDDDLADDVAAGFGNLWEAAALLETVGPASVDAAIWRRRRVHHLWLT